MLELCVGFVEVGLLEECFVELSLFVGCVVVVLLGCVFVVVVIISEVMLCEEWVLVWVVEFWLYVVFGVVVVWLLKLEL